MKKWAEVFVLTCACFNRHSLQSRRPAPVDGIYSDGKDEAYSELYIYNTIKILTYFSPDYAVDTYCDLQNLAVQPWRDFTMLLLNILMPSVQNRTTFSFR